MHEYRGIQFVTAVWFGGFADAFLLAERGRDMPLLGCSEQGIYALVSVTNDQRWIFEMQVFWLNLDYDSRIEILYYCMQSEKEIHMGTFLQVDLWAK